MTSRIIMAGIAAAVVGGALLFLLTAGAGEEFHLAPQPVRNEPAQQPQIASIAEVGTGWSTNEDASKATKEAIDMALRGKNRKQPDIVIVFASSGSDVEAILSTTKLLLGKQTKIFGGTSDSRAVMTEKGFLRISKRGYQLAETEGHRGLAIMTVACPGIVWGTAAAGQGDFGTPQEMAAAAAASAIRSAGRADSERPRILLLASTIGIEEEVLEGIQEVVGPNTPVLGGTVGGPVAAVFGQDKVYDKGISLAVIYTDLPVGWTFEGGFDVTDRHTGVVTKVEGQTIVEIDHRPALDVYDEWLGGEIDRLYEEIAKPDVIRDLLILHPLYRRCTSPSGQDYFLFSHPWPKDSQMKERSISTGTKIRVGERVWLSHGTWETLINRIGNLPRNAMIHGGLEVDSKPLFGIGFICGGVMGVIPEAEREKISILINYANQHAPFIANFTWGEQGHFPGIGNRHGNLLTSFIVVGAGPGQ
jgi:hypothetical protein